MSTSMREREREEKLLHKKMKALSSICLCTQSRLSTANTHWATTKGQRNLLVVPIYRSALHVCVVSGCRTHKKLNILVIKFRDSSSERLISHLSCLLRRTLPFWVCISHLWGKEMRPWDWHSHMLKCNFYDILMRRSITIKREKRE